MTQGDRDDTIVTRLVAATMMQKWRNVKFCIVGGTTGSILEYMSVAVVLDKAQLCGGVRMLSCRFVM